MPSRVSPLLYIEDEKEIVIFFISLLLSVVLFTGCITEDEYDKFPWKATSKHYGRLSTAVLFPSTIKESRNTDCTWK